MAEFYVGTSGGSSAVNSIGTPWDLGYACNGANGSIGFGATVWLRGGTYNRDHLNILAHGTTGQPIVWRNYNNEHVIYNATGTVEWSLGLGGSHCWVWGWEIMHGGSAIEQTHVSFNAPFIKLINCYIHDGQMGMADMGVEGSEEYGNVVIFNGRNQSAAEGAGYGNYVQNLTPATTNKYFTDNIYAYNWSWNVTFYTETSLLKNIKVVGNAFYAAAYLWRGGSLYGANVTVSTPDGSYTGFVFASNYVAAPPVPGVVSGAQCYMGQYFTLSDIVATGNYFVGQNYPSLNIDNNGTNNVISGNVFMGPTGIAGNQSAFEAAYPTNEFSDTWSATRTTNIAIRPNAYEAKRANYIIMNWGSAATVGIDPSSILSSGDTFVLRDPLNWNMATGVAMGTWTSGTIPVPMTGLTVATHLIGTPVEGPIIKHTAPFFAAFVLIGTAGAAGETPVSNSIIIFG